MIVKRSPWWIWPLAGALVVALPMAVILRAWIVPVGSSDSSHAEMWAHLREHVLTGYITNSLWLLVGVGGLTGVIGVLCAWLIAAYDFPGRRWLDWALLLPLALPTYISAFTYAGWLGELGPVQRLARAWFDVPMGQHLPFPEIRSLPGVILVMSCVLYPYVYLICRAVIASQIQHLTDIARTMGMGPWQRFFRIAFPLARPALVAGVGLAVMEALSDFGSVSFYGVDTFTTGIYRTWFNFGDVSSAARLAGLLMLFMLGLIAVERLSRRRIHVSAPNAALEVRRDRLTGVAAVAALFSCLLPVVFGFVVPVGQLAVWSLAKHEVVLSADFWAMTGRSVGLGLAVAGVVVALAVMLRFTQRLLRSPLVEACNRLASIGYAIPGSVLAVGVMIPLAAVDHSINDWARALEWAAPGLILSGSVLALAYSYVVRFMAVAFNTVDSGFARLAPQLDEAALCLGARPLEVLGRVHLPVLRGSLLAALALVLIDVLKELPATLILRPFNFDTLATKTYELAVEERLPEAAVYAIGIVIAGLLPIYLLVRSINRSAPAASTSLNAPFP